MRSEFVIKGQNFQFTVKHGKTEEGKPVTNLIFDIEDRYGEAQVQRVSLSYSELSELRNYLNASPLLSN